MTPEARAARERKQKIFVVVGGLLLLAMLAFQLPKLLGGSPSPEATPTTTPGAAAAGQPAVRGAAPVALVGSTASGSGKLTSFSVFAAKDPFVQQVVTENGLEAPPEGEAKSGGGSTAKAAGSTMKFGTGKTRAAAVTIVTVNGARQVLEPGMRFPTGDPLFVLVAEKPGSKSVVVGIVGGAYSGGAKTTTLKAGKPITLVNTTTGARYKISLVSVGSGEAAAEATPKP
ncbi:MAG TPA: hypothetical protein VFN06_04755 [Gaiellaceae bacterium]|nr:hypothetical protein [Gaiellaceae bacterium]